MSINATHPDFVKAYGHNGYFKSLKAIVHFYNTRDVLPRCRPNDPGEGVDMLARRRSRPANINTRFMEWYTERTPEF